MATENRMWSEPMEKKRHIAQFAEKNSYLRYHAKPCLKLHAKLLVAWNHPCKKLWEHKNALSASRKASAPRGQQ